MHKRNGRWYQRAVKLAVVATAAAAVTVAPTGTASATGGEWIDTTYGMGGVTRFAGAPTINAFAGETDALDRTYVVMSENDSTSQVRRLTAGGQVDGTFAGGLLTWPWAARGVQLDSAGTVTLAGVNPLGGVVVSRFTGSGGPDTGFGSTGTVNVLGTEQVTSVTDTVEMPGGGLIIAVLDQTDFPTSGYLVALTSAGQLDESWAPGASTPGVLHLPGALIVSLAADGAAVVTAGYQNADEPLPPRIQRFTAAGAPDSTFSSDGVLELPMSFEVGKLVAQPGAYFLTGSQPTGMLGQRGMAALKVLASGSIDSSFGDDGIAVGNGHDCGNGAGNIFFAATTFTLAGGYGCGSGPVLLNRFSLSGVLDTTYGTGGAVTIHVVVDHEVIGGGHATVQSSGQIVIATGAFNASPSGSDGVVFRLRATPVPPAAGSFVSLSPTRILDTRNGTGVPAGAVPGQGSVNLQITGVGGVPASGVGAVVLNVTVTQPNWDGSVVAFPTGEPKPLASNLNFVAGQTIPNLVTVKVGAGGQVTLANNQIPGKTLHLVADVAGYYLSGAAVEPGTYTPLVPSRLLDTRNGTGAPAGPIPGQGSVNLQITGQGGVPASGVGAVVLNVTVTQPNWDGSVVAYPTGEPKPLASNLNFAANQTIPNLVTVKVGAGGQVTLANNQIPGKTLHLVADVAGYYLAGTPMLPGTYKPLTPLRILDTRNGTGVEDPGPVLALSEITLNLEVAANGAVSDRRAAAVVMNVTVTQPSWDGFVVVYPTGTTAPLASNLNFVPNQTIPNLVVVKLGAFSLVNLRNGSTNGTVHLVADLAGYFLN